MKRLAALTMMTALAPATALASEARGPNRSFAATGRPATSVVRALDAASLVYASRAAAAPDLLVAAARMAAEANAQAGTRRKKTEGGAAETAKAPVTLEVPKLLADAIAGGTAAGHHELVRHTGYLKQSPPAPGRHRSYVQSERVAAGATDLFEIAFEGGAVAQVGIVGTGEADLDLSIFDDLWNPVCASTTDAAREYCSWTPAVTGTFRIRVKNQGPAADDYVFATN